MDELRFNMVRALAYAAAGPMATESGFVAAYAAADEHLTHLGWIRLD